MENETDGNMANHSLMYPTKYYGIFIRSEGGLHWLTETGNGSDQFFGSRWPSDSEIDQFRNAVATY